jgi:hypothetical protein
MQMQQKLPYEVHMDGNGALHMLISLRMGNIPLAYAKLAVSERVFPMIF